jgi:2,3-bisphosphoglycerate-independent phosphoglycerate mutase
MAGEKQFVLVIPDGAGDVDRLENRSPLSAASIPHWNWLAAEGVCGLMQTLYDDLPRGSIVAQLGMLGWNPYLYSGHGRAIWELLALSDVQLGPDDLVCRANLVWMKERRLLSYNAGFILTETAVPLVERINALLGREFPGLELHHNCDFRNSLVIRKAGIDPAHLVCPEPHDNEGTEFEISHLIAGKDADSEAVAALLNRYLGRVAEVLAGEPANMIFPWSASRSFTPLPSFRDNTGFEGRSAIVGCMDFLQGIAKVGGIDFFKVGNGRPDTDYASKGAKVLELLDAGYSFVVCHVNSPDEAAHMHDREMKIQCLEAIDRHILGPIVDYFRSFSDRLGGVMVAPDHYTNLLLGSARADAHSLHPVPFVLWDGSDRDEVSRFDEDSVRAGLYGATPVSHLDLLAILGVARPGAEDSPARASRRADSAPAIGDDGLPDNLRSSIHVLGSDAEMSDCSDPPAAQLEDADSFGLEIP